MRSTLQLTCLAALATTRPSLSKAPAGQRIEQHDIDLMRFIPPDKAA
jgi:hypothetical protein